MSSGDRVFTIATLLVVAGVIIHSWVRHRQFMKTWNAEVEASKASFKVLEQERIRNALREAEEMGYDRGYGQGRDDEASGSPPK